MKKLTNRILIISSGFLILTIGISYFLFSFNKNQYFVCATELPQGFCGTEMPQLSEKGKLGKKVFAVNCAACHKPTKNMTGPALAVMLDKKKFPYPNYIYDFVTKEDSLLKIKKYRTEFINSEYNSEFNHNFKLTTIEFNNLLEYVSERSSIKNETSVMTKGFGIGKDLFKDDCNVCHKERGIINTRYMKETIKDVGREYFRAFISNQDSLVNSKDIYALKVKEEYNYTANAHNFKYSEKEINGLIEYIKDK
ncbi:MULTISPECIES: c-type cytochrome [Flavobacteriaceae]|uniref:c-type cytochrome n=1 Tax=Flavobacteriaceae TaxID=49546 RepID=UPI001491AE8B|nr:MULTISPECIES: cytochrome c [Allomuricauda]MDC6367608.1 cytochrome c [Muricauda sp. AC10]